MEQKNGGENSELIPHDAPQSHRLTVEDPVTVEYITRYIASLKQVGACLGTVRHQGAV